MARVLLLTVLLSLCISGTYGQEMYTEYEVAGISFSGNATLKTDELQTIIQTKETPSWLWKSLFKVSESVGKKPEYFNPSQFGEDAGRLKDYYISNGFRAAIVDTTIFVDRAAKSVTLGFQIKEGRRSYIDTLKYEGLENLPGDLNDEIRDHKLIEVGDPFIEKKVVDEQRRVVNVFANYGYVQVHVDTLLPIQYASTNNISILFSFSPGNRYKFGRIEIQSDTTVKQQVDPAVTRRYLDFKEGDYFNLNAKTQSEMNLNRVGVFESAQIEEVVSDSSRRLLEIPMNVFVRPRPFYELSPEIGVNDERGYPNVSFALGYIDRNFFGGARNFNSRVRLNVHSLRDLELVRAFRKDGLRDSTILTNADVTINFIQPYFFNNKTSLTTTLFAALEKQRTYYSPIFRFRIGAAAQTATYTRAFIDWSLEAIHPQSTVTGLDTAFAKNTQAELKAQFNSILTFTLQRDLRNDFFSATQGFFHSITLEEAGILPSAFNGLFGLGLPYAKYLKISALAQWYWDPGQLRSFVWATKLHAGAAQLYGNSPSDVPLTRRFYAGGSGSIRGWGARQLGMVDTTDTGGDALIEASLEARWNPLQNADDIWFFETRKFSFVFFYDIGNLWGEAKRMRLSELAMASGIGFRYETVAGPIRLDFGWRVFDPKALPGDQWITNKRFFSQVLPNFVFHLGVGQAF